jgi:hypothetical protein
MTAEEYKVYPTLSLLVSAVFSLGCDAVFGIEDGQLARITADAVWSQSTRPTLKGVLFVEAGATLTIEPGTTVLADPGSALIVKQGGKLNACGTKEAPIAFTSSQGTPKAGDWGGLAIAGNAQANDAETSPFKDLPGTVNFGGAIDEDSSGQLCFVRIEFAGGEVGEFDITPLKLLGVGSRTTIHHVQVHGAIDDSISLVGGAVGLKHVLVTAGGEDNGIKWEGGWRGKAQFVAVVMTPTQLGNGLEGKNGDDSTDLETNPTIYNATVVGQNVSGDELHGVLFSEGTKGQFLNFFIMNFKRKSLFIEDAETFGNAQNGSLDLRNSAFSSGDGNYEDDLATMINTKTWATDISRQNLEISTREEILQSVTPDAPNLAIRAGNSALLTGGAPPPNDNFFDRGATFIGACRDTCADFEGWTLPRRE